MKNKEKRGDYKRGGDWYMSSVKDKEDPEGGLMKGVRGMNSSQITDLDSSQIT